MRRRASAPAPVDGRRPSPPVLVWPAPCSLSGLGTGRCPSCPAVEAFLSAMSGYLEAVMAWELASGEPAGLDVPDMPFCYGRL